YGFEVLHGDGRVSRAKAEIVIVGYPRVENRVGATQKTWVGNAEERSEATPYVAVVIVCLSSGWRDGRRQQTDQETSHAKNPYEPGSLFQSVLPTLYRVVLPRDVGLRRLRRPAPKPV